MKLGRIGRPLLAGTLAAALFAGALRASEAPAPAPKAASVSEPPGAGLLLPLPYAPTRIRSARTIGGTSGQSRVGDADEDKQRVPKPPDESRRKPEPGAAPQATESTSDESSCAGSCIGSFFESLFSSDSKPSQTPPPPSIAPTGMAWLPGARGEIHADMPVPIWDGSGGPGAGRNQVGVLPPRTRVTVLESNASIEGLWLRVQPVSADGPVGWMDSGYLGPFTEPEVPETAALPPERYSVWLALGGGIVGPSDLDLEYTEGGFRAEGQFLRTLSGPWQLGAAVGYRNFQGTPQVLYTTPSVVEEPTNSTLQLVDIGLRGGQRFGTSRSHGLRFTWLLGAGTVLVDEKADVVVLASASGPETGRREDSLSRWRFGGDLQLALGWPVGPNVDLGFLLGGWVVDWQGEKKLSLTTDFLTEPIYGFDAALCFSFGGR